MESFRNNPPEKINGQQVVMLMDYELQVKKNLMTNEEWKLELPKSNVLQFVLDDLTFISARPSGTEPKIKFYFSGNTKLDNAAEFEKVNKQLDEQIKAVIADMKL